MFLTNVIAVLCLIVGSFLMFIVCNKYTKANTLQVKTCFGNKSDSDNRNRKDEDILSHIVTSASQHQQLNLEM